MERWGAEVRKDGEDGGGGAEGGWQSAIGVVDDDGDGNDTDGADSSDDGDSGDGRDGDGVSGGVRRGRES